MNLNNLKKSPGYKIGKEKRGNTTGNDFPGPNVYDVKYNFKNSPGYSLGKEKKHFKPNLNPGPGQYNTELKHSGGITMKRRYYFKDKDSTPGPNYYNSNPENVLKHSPAYSYVNYYNIIYYIL